MTVDFSAAAPTPRYDIVIGHSIISEAGTLVRMRLGERRCIIITDSNVELLYRARVEAVLASGGHDVLATLTVPAGSTSKTLVHLQGLIEKTLSLDIDRQSVIIALGGGMVGDLAGLLASVLLRGLDLVHIPTTLLAQVDSCIGGKTAVDTPYGKNTIGTFYQPRLVLSDVTFLDSLSARDMRAGYAEIFKYGLTQDVAFFRWCLAHGAKLLNGHHKSQVQAVGYCCAAKTQIVSLDERNLDDRIFLNFGDTYGHMIETAVGDTTLLNHGEAVSIGMAMAIRLSVRLGCCTQSEYDVVADHLASVGLPIKLPSMTYDSEYLLSLMRRDKKYLGQKISMILMRGIGQTFVSTDVDIREIKAVWEELKCQ